MSVRGSVRLLCWALVVILPWTLLADETGSAILHAQGGVWVNGGEARDALTIVPGDLLETKPGFVANLTADGSAVMIQPESVVKFQGDHLILEHGSLSVETSKGLSVHINCLQVVPVLKEWTQYEVIDVNGTVQVFARKRDVNITREANAPKLGKDPNDSQNATVHEGERRDRDESAACGAAELKSASSVPHTKLIVAGGGIGAGVLICVLLHCFGSGTNPVSPSQP